MKLNEIKQELKGYFIYRNNADYELAIRQGNDIKLITDNISVLSFKDRFELTPIRYLLMQINNQLLDPLTYINELSEVLPVIDFRTFQLYDDREIEIARHKELLNQISESKSIFGRKKDFKLVYVESHNHLYPDKEQKGYYVIKNNDVIPIETALLDDYNLDAAIEVKHLDDLKKALKDDLTNQYKEIYEQACREWDSLI